MTDQHCNSTTLAKDSAVKSEKPGTGVWNFVRGDTPDTEIVAFDL